MNKNLKRGGVVLAAVIGLSAPSYALTSKQATDLRTTVLGVAVPEMPAKAAELVSQADKADQEAVAVTVVKAVVFKHRAAAPLIVAAVSKAAPDVAPAASAAATELSAEQAPSIARAAAISAPSRASEISSRVSLAAPAQAQVIPGAVRHPLSVPADAAPVLAVRGGADEDHGNGSGHVNPEPIDYSHGHFPHNHPVHPEHPPHPPQGPRHH
jgi:hypothetical protein